MSFHRVPGADTRLHIAGRRVGIGQARDQFRHTRLPHRDTHRLRLTRDDALPPRRRHMMANVRAERLLKLPAEPNPELRIPNAQLKRE